MRIKFVPHIYDGTNGPDVRKCVDEMIQAYAELFAEYNITDFELDFGGQYPKHSDACRERNPNGYEYAKRPRPSRAKKSNE